MLLNQYQKLLSILKLDFKDVKSVLLYEKYYQQNQGMYKSISELRE